MSESEHQSINPEAFCKALAAERGRSSWGVSVLENQLQELLTEPETAEAIREQAQKFGIDIDDIQERLANEDPSFAESLLHADYKKHRLTGLERHEALVSHGEAQYRRIAAEHHLADALGADRDRGIALITKLISDPDHQVADEVYREVGFLIEKEVLQEEDVRPLIIAYHNR